MPRSWNDSYSSDPDWRCIDCGGSHCSPSACRVFPRDEEMVDELEEEPPTQEELEQRRELAADLRKRQVHLHGVQGHEGAFERCARPTCSAVRKATENS